MQGAQVTNHCKTQSGFVYIIEAQDICQGKDDIGRLA